MFKSNNINNRLIILLLFLILFTHFYIFINHNRKSNFIDGCKYNMLEDNISEYQNWEKEKRWKLQYLSMF